MKLRPTARLASPLAASITRLLARSATAANLYCVASLLAAPFANAATLYWDGNDTTANADGGAGTWNTANTNWDTLQTAGVNSVWTNANLDSAIFGGTAGTVTLGSAIDIGGLQFNTTGYTINSTGFSLNFAAANNSIVLNSIAAATITGPVGGTGNVTLAASNLATAGTLTLNGTSTGGWTGSTTVNTGATLSLAGLNQGLLNTSGITLNGGNITLTSADSLAEDDLDRVSDSAVITSNGGTITYTTTTAASTKAFIETIGSVALTSGQLNLVQSLDKSAGSQTLALSGLTQAGTSAVTFSNSGGLNATNDVIRVNGITASTAAGQIIGSWATVGTSAAAQTDYAIYNSDGTNGRVVASNIAATAESTWAADTNVTLANATGSGANGRFTATRNVNTLRSTTAATAVTATNATDVFNSTAHGYAAGDVVILAGTAPAGLTAGTLYYVINPTANTFQLSTASGGTAALFTNDGTAVTITAGVTLSSGNNLGTYGILNGSTATLAIGASGTGAVTLPSTTSGNLHVNAGSGAITIAAPINNNGAGVLTLVKNGSGTLTLSSTTSNYSGGTVVNAGTLYTTAQTNIGAGLVTINAGGTFRTGPLAYTQNMTLNGGTLSIGSDGQINSNLSGTITLSANSLISTTKTNSGVGKINGPVTGAGGFTKTGDGGLQLNSANNYTGPTVVSGTATSSGLTVKSSLYGNDTTKWTPANITVASGNAFALNVGGAGEFSMAQAMTMFGQLSTGLSNNGLLAGSIIGIDTRNATPGSTFVYSNVIANSTGAGGGQVSFKFTGINGATSATSTTMELTGANTYTGATIVENHGILKVSSFNSVGTGPGYAPMASSSLGAPTTVANGTIHLGAGNPISNIGNTFLGGSITYTGSGEITDRVLSLNGGGGDFYTLDQSGTGLLKFVSNFAMVDTRGTKTITLQGSTAGTGEIAGVIPTTTSGTMAVVKSGTGTWTLSGANLYTGSTTLTGGGTLVLDYGTQNNSKLADTTGALVLAGGSLTLKGGSHVEAVTSTSLNAGGTFITRDTGSSSLQLAVLTRAAGSSISFGGTGIATVSLANSNSILGGFATLGNDWAVGGAGNTAVTALGAGSYTAVNNATPGAGSSTGNHLLSGGATLSAGFAANTLKIVDTLAGQSLALGTNNLTITSASATALGGLMYAGGTDGNYTISGSTGRIVTSTANQELIFQTTTGTLTINAFVGLSGSTGIVTKAGTGTLVLGGANNYTGVTRVNQGVLRLAHATGAGSASNTANLGIIVQNGAALELSNTITVGAEALTITGNGVSNGGALANQSGTNTYGGAVTIGAGGARINSTADSLTLTGGVVTSLLNNVTFGGAGTTNVNTVGITGAGNLIKDGDGTVILRADNTYTGATIINGGELRIGNGSAAGALSGTSGVTNHGVLRFGRSDDYTAGYSISGTGELQKFGNGTLTLTGNHTYTGATSINVGTLQLDGSTHASSTVAIATLGTLTGSGTVNGNATLTGNGVINKSSGTIAGTLAVTGGNWNGAGTVTGAVTSSSGTFNIGSGANLTANGGLNVTGGTLSASDGTSTITGNVNYTSGSNSSFAGKVSGSGKTLTMDSAGSTLTLTGTNTYTGATNVTQGTLVINGSVSTSVLTTVSSGATLGGGGTVGALTISSGGFVTPGNSPGVLTVNGNYTQAGTYTAEITGTTPGIGGYDQIAVNGTVDITGGSLSALFSGTGYIEGDLLFILLNDGTDAITGTYAGFAQGVTVVSYDGLDWAISYNADSATNTFTGTLNGNDIALRAIPEPRAALLGGLGLLLLLRRRQRG